MPAILSPTLLPCQFPHASLLSDLPGTAATAANPHAYFYGVLFVFQTLSFLLTRKKKKKNPTHPRHSTMHNAEKGVLEVDIQLSNYNAGSKLDNKEVVINN